jgi:hypothetical protein
MQGPKDALEGLGLAHASSRVLSPAIGELQGRAVNREGTWNRPRAGASRIPAGFTVGVLAASTIGAPIPTLVCSAALGTRGRRPPRRTRRVSGWWRAGGRRGLQCPDHLRSRPAGGPIVRRGERHSRGLAPKRKVVDPATEQRRSDRPGPPRSLYACCGPARLAAARCRDESCLRCGALGCRSASQLGAFEGWR